MWVIIYLFYGVHGCRVGESVLNSYLTFGFIYDILSKFYCLSENLTFQNCRKMIMLLITIKSTGKLLNDLCIKYHIPFALVLSVELQQTCWLKLNQRSIIRKSKVVSSASALSPPPCYPFRHVDRYFTYYYPVEILIRCLTSIVCIVVYYSHSGSASEPATLLAHGCFKCVICYYLVLTTRLLSRFFPAE